MHALLLLPPALRAALAPRLAAHGLPARDLPLHPAALLPALLHDEPALALFGGGAACLPLLRRTRMAGFRGLVALLVHTPDPSEPAITDPTCDAIADAWSDLDALLPTDPPTDAELAELCATARARAASLPAPTPLPGRTLDEKVRAAEEAYATQVLSRTKSGTRAAQKLGTHLDRLRRLTKGSD